MTAKLVISDHSQLGGLTTGDDHTQYFYLPGRAGGQVAIGGTLTTQLLTLQDNVADANQITFGPGEVTALSLQAEGHTTALPTPKQFKRRPEFGVELLTNGTPEPIGERIFVQAESVRASLTLTFKSKLVRCDLVKTGRMLYNPSRR